MRFLLTLRQLKTMTANQQASERITALDGVRGVAILLVLVMHSLYIGPLFGLDVMAHPYARAAWLGWSGVDVFFVLSGFLITGILVRSKGRPHYFRNFYARRSLRIFPLYYLVVCLLLFVLPNRGFADGDVVPHLLYYQNFLYAFPPGAHDAALEVTWSLAIEEQFYLLWPLLVWLLSLRGLRVLCVGAIVGAIGLRIWLVGQGLERTHFLTPCRLDTLAAGALLAVTPKPAAWFGWVAAPLGVVGLVWTASACGMSLPIAPAMQQVGLVCTLLMGVGVLTLARSSTRLQPVFGLAALRLLGKYSYCIYLTHMLVIEWLAGQLQAMGPELAGALQGWSPLLLTIGFTLAVVAHCLVLGFLSYHVFERWFLALKRFFPSGG